MSTHITVRVGAKSKSRRGEHSHDDNREPAGWAKAREPKDEPYVTNKNMSLGRWLDRASANSGPKIAPGIGTKKSSQ
jgi:hypothetical protein